MGIMTDAVDPAHIPAELDGKPALRISVLANHLGEAFDVEKGDAGPSAMADAVAVRVQNRQWSIVYVSESLYGAAVGALATKGLRLAPASEWPAPGVYLWCAAPGLIGNQVPPWAEVAPIAVQNQYLGDTDESTTFGEFPALVAGYIDGPESTWPTEAWNKYSVIGAPAESPVTTDPPQTGETDMPLDAEAMAQVQAAIDHATTLILYGDSQEAAEGKAVQGHPFNLLQMNQTLDAIKAKLGA